MKKTGKIFLLGTVLALSFALTACSGKSAESTTADASGKASETSTSDTSGSTNTTGSTDSASTTPAPVKKVRVAYTQAYVPYDYVNDQGEADGFEVQVLKEVDNLLPDYEFEFEATSDDDLLIGIKSGKYNLGVKGAWYTEERSKTYLYPQNYIAASIIGLTFRTENADQIKDIDSFAKFSGKLVPIAPQNAQYAIVEQYNKEHPDNQIELTSSEAFNVSDAYTWVLEGRYDAYFDIKLSYENNVKSEEGPYHDLADKLSYVPYKAIPTYPLFNQEDQALADAYDSAITQLTESGKITELSQKYFNENIFENIK